MEDSPMIKAAGMIIAGILFFFSLSSGQSINIYRKGTPTVFPLSEVDSITFTPALPGNVLSLRIDMDEVSGWNEEPDGFREFHSLEHLAAIMNGGAEMYYQRGVVEGFVQYMSKSGTEYAVESRIMDFAGTENAENMYLFRRENASTVDSAGNFSQNDAFIDPDASLTGCCGYAHFGKYYIEVFLSGFSSNKTEACSNASSFIEVFKMKIDAFD